MITESNSPQSSTSSGLICIKAKKLRRHTQRVLYSAGIRPVVEMTMDECAESDHGQDHPFLLYYVDSIEEMQKDSGYIEKMVSQASRNYVAFLLDSPDRNLIARLLSSTTVANIVSPSHTSDLFVSLRKIRSGDLFGLEKYLAWGVLESRYRMTSSDEKGEVISKLETFIDGLRGERQLTDSACTVADEFITNAFYNAPVSEDGIRLYRDRDRTDPVVLENERGVEFSFASDGHRLAISCRDSYGSISNEQILEQLSRAFEHDKAEVSQGTGGAGVGLYLIYNYVANLIINVDPGKASEFIGIFDLQATKKEQRTRTRGLNVFVSA